MNTVQKKKITSSIYKALIKINSLANLNIDFEKTNSEFLYSQITPKFLNIFTEAQEKGLIKNEDNFILFLNKNQSFIKNIKVYKKSSKRILLLNTVISKFLKESEKNLISNKLFYFYLNIIIVEYFHKINNSKLSKEYLKKKIEEIINSKCLNEKKNLLKCFFKNKKNIDVTPLNLFEKNINKTCKPPKDKLESCLRLPTQLSLNKIY